MRFCDSISMMLDQKSGRLHMQEGRPEWIFYSKKKDWSSKPK
jgi:hypothetical protein